MTSNGFAGTITYSPELHLNSLVEVVHHSLARIEQDKEQVRFQASYALLLAIGADSRIDICNVHLVDQAQLHNSPLPTNLDALIASHIEWTTNHQGKRLSGQEKELLISNSMKLNAAIIWRVFLTLFYRPNSRPSTAQLSALKSLRILSTVSGQEIEGEVRAMTSSMSPEERSFTLKRLNSRAWPAPAFIDFYFKHRALITG
jgi:hypothetical protein